MIRLQRSCCKMVCNIEIILRLSTLWRFCPKTYLLCPMVPLNLCCILDLSIDQRDCNLKWAFIKRVELHVWTYLLYDRCWLSRMFTSANNYVGSEPFLCNVKVILSHFSLLVYFPFWKAVRNRFPFPAPNFIMYLFFLLL